MNNFSAISCEEQVTFDEMMIYYTNMLSLIFIVLAMLVKLALFQLNLKKIIKQLA